MIFYKKDIVGLLREIGYDTKKIKQTGVISQSTITAIKNNRSITISSLDRICTILKRQPGDLIGWRLDK